MHKQDALFPPIFSLLRFYGVLLRPEYVKDWGQSFLKGVKKVAIKEIYNRLT